VFVGLGSADDPDGLRPGDKGYFPVPVCEADGVIYFHAKGRWPKVDRMIIYAGHLGRQQPLHVLTWSSISVEPVRLGAGDSIKLKYHIDDVEFFDLSDYLLGDV